MSGEDAEFVLANLKETYDTDAISTLKDILSPCDVDYHFGTREQYREWKKRQRALQRKD